MNLQISLQKQAHWTPSLVVVESLHQSNPRSSSEHFPLVCSRCSDFAWSLFKIKYLTNKIEVYVFKYDFCMFCEQLV